MKKIIGIALAIVALVVLQLQFDIFHLKATSLKIDKTANVVEEIKKISEFTTACFYEEQVMQDKRVNEGLFATISGDDELVLITRGTVRAGFDLASVAETMRMRGDTVVLRLPEPKIFDVIINPSDYDVYVEKGSWSHEQTVALVAEAQNKVREDAIESGVLQMATENGEKKLRQLFGCFGFNTVLIER